MTESALYFGGVPTDIDIKKIRDKWPDADMQLGQTIACEDVAAEIGVTVTSNRFLTVTSRWRKLVEKGPTNHVIGKRHGEFIVLKDGEVVNSNESDLRSAVKKTRRASIRSARVDVAKLSDDERKRHDMHIGLSAKLLGVASIRKNGAVLPRLE